MRFNAAQKVADAVLYEGYVLYPYRASSDKNRVRFQFGVLAPRSQAERDGSETWDMQTECLVIPGTTAVLDVRVRFLQLQARSVEAADPAAVEGFTAVESLDVGEEPLVTWDEATEEHVDVAGRIVADLVESAEIVPFSLGGARVVEHVHGRQGEVTGRVVRSRWPIDGRVIVSAEALQGIVRVRVRVENVTAWFDPDGGRDQTLRRSLLGCHTLMAVSGGTFASMTDPPAHLRDAVKASVNRNTWPVLVGEPGGADVVLSSPIILPDHPEIAPESPGDLFDATEIDEILTLRIMTLTDDEKRSARATDPRARRIIDRADAMPPEMLDKLHGAIRYLRGGPAGRSAESPPTESGTPGAWDPEARIEPEVATIQIRGHDVGKGSSVRIQPRRRADAMDLFLAGRVATVEAIFETVDDETHVAVTIDDDPATDLHRAYGRFFYFGPDELEPLATTSLDAEAVS
jgi:hypothetical protein